MRKLALGVALAAAALLALGASAVAAPGNSGNKYPKQTDARDCEGGDQIVFDGAKELWPPNHKYQSFSVTADGDTDGEGVTIDTVVTSSEGEFELGSGHTALDVVPPINGATGTGEATVSHQVRSERSGRNKEGRTYTVDVTADFDSGLEQDCTARFTIHVAHDQRGGAGWRGL